MILINLFLFLIVLASAVQSQNIPFDLPVTFKVNDLDHYTLTLKPDGNFYVIYHRNMLKEGEWAWIGSNHGDTRLILRVKRNPHEYRDRYYWRPGPVIVSSSNNGIDYVKDGRRVVPTIYQQVWKLKFNLDIDSKIDMTLDDLNAEELDQLKDTDLDDSLDSIDSRDEVWDSYFTELSFRRSPCFRVNYTPNCADNQYLALPLGICEFPEYLRYTPDSPDPETINELSRDLRRVQRMEEWSSHVNRDSSSIDDVSRNASIDDYNLYRLN